MEQKPTLFDRFAVGFLNLVVGLPTGFLLWVALNGFPWGGVGWLPAIYILWFTGVMVILGVLMQEVIFLSIYSKCWRFLYYWFKGGG
jgi:hypothetical protein